MDGISVIKNREGVNPPTFSFFDEIVVLTLGEPKRVAHINQELDYQRIKRVKFFEGLKGFNQSVYALLEKYQETDKLLVLEDDCAFFVDKQIEKAIGQLPNDWDILSFGSNLQSEHYLYSDNLVMLTDGWMTHAMGYSKKMIKVILEKFNPDKDVIFDEWLRLNIYKDYQCFMTYPISAWQLPSYSHISEREVDYMVLLPTAKSMIKI